MLYTNSYEEMKTGLENLQIYKNGLTFIPYHSDLSALPNEPLTFIHKLVPQADRCDALLKIGFEPTGYVPFYGEKIPRDADFYYLINHALVHGVNKYDLDVILTEFDDVDMYPDWGSFDYENFECELRYMILIATGGFRREPYMLRDRQCIKPPKRLKF
jgi:hypothetical protein